MKKEVDFTAVITAHNEGLIAHKTMRSVFEALDNVEKAGYTYEIIIHIDNGDKDTLAYFNRYEDNKKIRIFKNSFGDTGPSRNFALEKANGKYVGFLDGDDLITNNYYIESITMLEELQEEVVVHPEAIITFGTDQPNVLTLQKDSSKDDLLVLLGENCWGSVLVAKKETLVKVPYKTVNDGYGHEDYIFNIEAIEKGIKHKIAPETVLFYRRSSNSRLSSSNNNRVIIPAMRAFDFGAIRIEDEVKTSHRETLKERGYRVYKKMRNNKKLNTFITPVAKVAIKVLDYHPEKKLPDFLINEWKNMNHIDSQLYPFDYILNKVKKYDAKMFLGVGRAYINVSKTITKKPDYVFIVPWVVRGGADKVLFNYIEALSEIHTDWHFAVISTLPVESTWAKNLPDNVDFIDFGNIAAGLNPDMQDKLMSLIVTQLRCKKLHIINSEYGYDWARTHMELLRKRYELNVSLFAWEYIKGSGMKCVQSYDNPCLFDIFSAVKNVFTDNKNMIKYTCENNGFTEEKFKVHYQPVSTTDFKPAKNAFVENGKIRLLWASRIVPSKLPDLVAKIGMLVDADKVAIDVYGQLDEEVKKDIFDNNPVVNYCGVYDGFSNLSTDNYDAFLYTSLNDGMPNVILEATAAGLPVIASNDGGVGEFIKNKKTGILIRNYLEPEPYAEAIKQALNDPDSLKEYVENAQELLSKQHSWKKFVDTVRKDI